MSTDDTDKGMPVVECQDLTKIYRKLLARQSRAVSALQQVS